MIINNKRWNNINKIIKIIINNKKCNNINNMIRITISNNNICRKINNRNKRDK